MIKYHSRRRNWTQICHDTCVRMLIVDKPSEATEGSDRRPPRIFVLPAFANKTQLRDTNRHTILLLYRHIFTL